MPITSLREIRLLKSLDHPAVVPCDDIAYEEGPFPAALVLLLTSPGDRSSFKLGKTFMVFPYMDHDLAGLLENRSVRLETPHIKQYAKQLLTGTAYLHQVRLPSPRCAGLTMWQNGILHRDMKAANLLINNDGRLMIADFGLARSIEKVTKGRVSGSLVCGRD